jgi:hypothetical protein
VEGRPELEGFDAARDREQRVLAGFLGVLAVR